MDFAAFASNQRIDSTICTAMRGLRRKNAKGAISKTILINKKHRVLQHTVFFLCCS